MKYRHEFRGLILKITEPQPPSSSLCKKCGGKTRADKTAGLCPRCVLVAAVQCITAEDHPALGSMNVVGKCPSVDQLNEELPGFTFRELLGRGGSGWTFLATQESLSRDVAVKIIQRPDYPDSESVDRFRLEAENLAKLNHPKIVTVHDFGSTERYNYIVMEFVPGSTLRTRMLGGKLSEDQAVSIARQICSAVDYAHQQGLIHRDIKPENVLLVSHEPEVDIRVADFGISKIIDRSDNFSELTNTGLIIGTPFYMAPEQNRPAAEVDGRADIYATGVLLYEMLTGRLPQGRFSAPSRISGGNSRLDPIVARALSNDPEDRYSKASEFEAELRRALKVDYSLHWLFSAVGLLLLIPLLFFMLKNLDSGSGNANAADPAVAQRTVGEPKPSGGNADEKNVNEKNADETNPFITKPVGSETDSGQPSEKTLDEENPFKVYSSATDPKFDGSVFWDVPTEHEENFAKLRSGETGQILIALSSLQDNPPSPPVDAINREIQNLLMEQSDSIKLQIIRALTKIDPKGSLDVLHSELSSGSTNVRIAVLTALEKIKDPDSVFQVSALLGAREHTYAVKTLTAIGAPSEQALLDFLDRETSWMKTSPVVKALGEVGTSKSLGKLNEIVLGNEGLLPSQAESSVRQIKLRQQRLDDQK